jgi:hypothetical protein
MCGSSEVPRSRRHVLPEEALATLPCKTNREHVLWLLMFCPPDTVSSAGAHQGDACTSRLEARRLTAPPLRCCPRAVIAVEVDQQPQELVTREHLQTASIW